MTGILETAVRATNAQFDSPEILKRLDVRLLEVLTLGPTRGPRGHVLRGGRNAVVSALAWGVAWRGEVVNLSWTPFLPACARHCPDAGRSVDRDALLCLRSWRSTPLSGFRNGAPFRVFSLGCGCVRAVAAWGWEALQLCVPSQVSPGDTGWDVFSLDYHVDGPIATVRPTGGFRAAASLAAPLGSGHLAPGRTR